MSGSPSHSQWSTGFTLRLLAIALFAGMAYFVKSAAAEAAIGQIVFYRSAVALVPLTFYLAWRGQFHQVAEFKHMTLHLGRAIIGGTAIALSFAAYRYLPLTIASGLSFLTPIMTVGIAVVLGREQITPRIFCAVTLGWFGVCLVILPDSQDPIDMKLELLGVACGIGAAALTAIAYTLVRRLTELQSPGPIATYFSVFVAMLSLVTLPWGWPTTSHVTLTSMIVAGLVGGCGQIAMTEAFARVPAADLAACDYTSLFWMVMVDAAVYNFLPSIDAAFGIVCVIASAALAAVNKNT